MSALEIRGDVLAPVYAQDRRDGRILEDLAARALRGDALPPPPAATPAVSGWARARRWLGAFLPRV
jgi:hypothetical protein